MRDAGQSRSGSAPAAAKVHGQRDQVIVIHPDHVVGLQHQTRPVGKQPVSPEIARHFLPVIFRQIQPAMKDRPQHPVGKAAITFIQIGL